MLKYKRNGLGMFIKKEHTSLICKVCNKSFQVIPSRSNTAKFCSQKCSQLYHTKENHHQYGKSPKKATRNKISETLTGKYSFEKSSGWKGGIRKHSSGYVLIHNPSHPNSFNGAVFEHRLVVEKKIKRFLKKTEVIHHINEVKDDNRIENLYLFSTTGKHTSYHNNLKNNKIKPITKSNLL